MSVVQIVYKDFQTSYRHWRSRLHDEYKKLVNKGLNLREQSPRLELTIPQWLSICDWVESDKFKKRSDINSSNRGKLPYVHTSGKIRYLSRYRKMNGRSKVQLWKDTHVKKTGEFVNPEAQSTFDKMNELETATTEGGEPISKDNILVSTLGYRSGYQKGMGGGVEVPRGSNVSSADQTELSQTRTELSQTQTELQTANQQIESLNQNLEEQREVNKSYHEKVEALQRQMQQMHELLQKLHG